MQTSFPYHEAFYSHRIWEPTIDRLFASRFLVLRGEYHSVAMQDRLNSGRRKAEIIKPGKMADSLFCDQDYGAPRSFEYGASECARTWEGAHSSKWIDDRAKLAILLRDQLVHINKWTYGRPDVLRRVQTIGFLTAGKLIYLVSSARQFCC